MSKSKSQADVPLDDVAALFSRLGERESAGSGYQVFSMSTLKEPDRVPVEAAVHPDAAAVTAAVVVPQSERPTPERARADAPAPATVQGAKSDVVARTPLQQLFHRLAEGGQVEMAGQDSPLRRLRS